MSVRKIIARSAYQNFLLFIQRTELITFELSV